MERKDIIPFHAMIWPKEMLGYTLNRSMNKMLVKIYCGPNVFVRRRREIYVVDFMLICKWIQYDSEGYNRYDIHV